MAKNPKTLKKEKKWGHWVRFTPNSEKDRAEMLKQAGLGSVQELFSDIPEKALIKKELKLPASLNERDLRKELESIAAKNKSAKQLSLFLGAGCYNHFVPAAVPAITGRSEFYTAYTPYQAEISQGSLQAIYEWQTYICWLTGLDAANASVYNGATAAADAMVMAKNITGKSKILASKSLNPGWMQVLRTYATAASLELEELALEELQELDGQTACVIVQQPNFFGCIESLQEIAEKAHSNNALLVVAVSEALSLAFLPNLGKEKADIVALDVQSFGNSMSFGGPAAGVIACRQQYIRHLPGRLVGRTTDSGGNSGFVLTLQAREQHIRREKASSNICTNQALNALASTVYLATLGEKGLKEIAGENHGNALYLAGVLEENGFEFPFGKDFFNEFVVKKPGIGELHKKLLGRGIVFGMLLEGIFPELKDCALVTATEMNSRQSTDSLAAALEELL
ncbi:MAG: aminomethyl-transferring glycine dehydrogenase subunit GcvPA [Candidatus Diapherotrites archaeon]|uniref:glycine dehydrogenase (aminomethyl-transferring) n=1 Tax=Candidatus Iainarchaeum sp. TaxID=3101447 RepID=A0A938YPD3_9ARCH|nr:aminomethyl-transferring glycine dehydrogenase subunit GcvPA [Candidatus Diapherotrites archaeon]